MSGAGDARYFNIRNILHLYTDGEVLHSVSSEVCLYKAGNTGGAINTSSSSVQGTHPSLQGLAAHLHNKPDQSNYTKQLYTQIFLTTSLP